jgi:hypothetical protein
MSLFLRWLYNPLGSWPLLFQFHDHFTDGRTPWKSDELVRRPLPKHRTTQTQNKHVHIPNIHALCGIRTHDSGFRGTKTVHVLDRSATVTGCVLLTSSKYNEYESKPSISNK